MLFANRLDPKFSELLTSNMKARSDRSNGNVHGFGHFFVAELFDLAQDKGRSKIGGQLIKQFFYKNTVLDIAALSRFGDFELGGFGFLGSEPVHAKPNAYSIDISGERFVVAKAIELSERF